MSDVKVLPEPAIDPGQASSSVGFLLSQLGFVLARRFHETLAPLQLEPRQFLLMRLVALNEGKTQQALSEASQIPASRMVAIVDELERRRLLERRANPSDRRARALHLTDEGRRLLGDAIAVAMEYEIRLCSGLESEEREVLIGLLQRLAAEQDIVSGVHPGLTTEDKPGC